MEAIVKLRAVSKDYGQGAVVVHALRGVDLEIPRGSFAALAGPSGSGKSTLLNILGGLDRPSSGTIQVDGQEVTRLGRAELARLRLRKIGFVFQAYNLLPVLTAYENAEYVLLMQGVPAAERRRRVLELLGQVGLEGLERRFPRELSGGQQQRVAIARALAQEPLVMLADEPVASLDPVTTIQVMNYLKKINREDGITTVANLHHVDLALKYATRVVGIRAGTIVYDKQMKDIDKDNFLHEMEQVYGRRIHSDEVLGDEE